MNTYERLSTGAPRDGEIVTLSEYREGNKAVVLRDFGEGATRRYVTHVLDVKNADHFWGHYHSDLDEATADFRRRAGAMMRGMS